MKAEHRPHQVAPAADHARPRPPGSRQHAGPVRQPRQHAAAMPGLRRHVRAVGQQRQQGEERDHRHVLEQQHREAALPRDRGRWPCSSRILQHDRGRRHGQDQSGDRAPREPTANRSGQPRRRRRWSATIARRPGRRCRCAFRAAAPAPTSSPIRNISITTPNSATATCSSRVREHGQPNGPLTMRPPEADDGRQPDPSRDLYARRRRRRPTDHREVDRVGPGKCSMALFPVPTATGLASAAKLL